MCAFKSAKNQHAYLDLLLERSKRCPLDIYVYHVSQGCPMRLRGDFEPYLLLQLGRVTRRWRCLHMNLPMGRSGGYPYPLHVFTLHTPLLEELCLDLNFHPNFRTRHPLVPQNYLPHCPKLRILVLQNTCDELAVIPWPYVNRRPLALVELDVRTAGITPDMQFAILRLAPHLAVLRVCDFNRYNMAITAPQFDLSLPSLRDLSLPSIPSYILPAWVPGLNLQNIESLDLTGQRFADLTNVLSNVQDTVTTLSFTLEDGDLCPTANAALFNQLSRLFRLRVLRVSSAGRMDPRRFFQALRERRVSAGQPAVETSVWPGLQVLQLRGAGNRAVHLTESHAERAAQALFDLVVAQNAPRARDAQVLACHTPPSRLTRIVLLGYKVDPCILSGIRVLANVEVGQGDSPWLSV